MAMLMMGLLFVGTTVFTAACDDTSDDDDDDDVGDDDDDDDVGDDDDDDDVPFVSSLDLVGDWSCAPENFIDGDEENEVSDCMLSIVGPGATNPNNTDWYSWDAALELTYTNWNVDFATQEAPDYKRLVDGTGSVTQDRTFHAEDTVEISFDGSDVTLYDLLADPEDDEGYTMQNDLSADCTLVGEDTLECPNFFFWLYANEAVITFTKM